MGVLGNQNLAEGCMKKKFGDLEPAICIDILTVNFHYNVKNKQTNKKNTGIEDLVGRHYLYLKMNSSCISGRK